MVPTGPHARVHVLHHGKAKRMAAEHGGRCRADNAKKRDDQKKIAKHVAEHLDEAASLARREQNEERHHRQYDRVMDSEE